MTATDPHLSETERVYAEYNAARTAWEADRTDELAKARFDRAQEAVRQTREYWRGVGVAAGTRPVAVLTVDNHDGPAPALVPSQEA